VGASAATDLRTNLTTITRSMIHLERLLLNIVPDLM